jgi:mono/diheme cytochrome c family protein
MKSRTQRAIATVLVLLASCIFTASLYAQTPAAGSDASTLFRTKCSGCHGANGGGDTEVGRTLKVPDLRSPEVQKVPRAELIDAITNGKNGRMPPFKDSLSPEQIRSLVQYIHQLPKSAN